MNAADDFIRVVLIGHVIALAMMHFGMHDMPTHADLQMINDENSDIFKQRHFHEALVRQHINLFTTECFGTCSSAAENGVQMYAHELLSLGLLYSEFRDGIKEGDGERVFLCWKFFLPIFRADRKSNYAIEALTYLAETTFLLPPRLREQLLRSRFINATGKEGGNIAADLHMEHLNRTVKRALAHQFSNLQPKAILRTGKICGILDSVVDKQTSVPRRSTTHTTSCFVKDITTITDQLVYLQVFTHKPERLHRNFTNLRSTITSPLHMRKYDFLTWLRNHIKKINP